VTWPTAPPSSSCPDPGRFGEEVSVQLTGDPAAPVDVVEALRA